MHLTFILVKPAVPQNIGAAARAMNTMGFTDLRLVDPECDHLDPQSWYMAHGSTDILKNARSYPTLQQAVEDCDLVVGTTARKRSVSSGYVTAHDLKSILHNKDAFVRRAALVFGSERHGLRNVDLELCHCVSTIPLNATYPSLNLAQAVMVYAYELGSAKRNCVEKRGTTAEYAALTEKAGRVLTLAGFSQESGIRRRLLGRMALLGEQDLHCVHSLCTKLLQKLQMVPGKRNR